jgi:alpha-tubulin suppressor-like RCC1 family protein
MIPTKTLEDKANTKIAAGSLSDLEYAQIASVDLPLSSNSIKAATYSALPAASTKKGVIYYVISENKYYFSDGVVWRSNFTSNSNNDAIPGILSGWGYNGAGQLGVNDITIRYSPVTAVGGLQWSSVSAGGQHSVGLTSAGVAYVWGSATQGSLGLGDLTSRRSPVTLPGGLTWSLLTAGQYHNVGLTTSGIAYAWGGNNYGQVGDGTTTSKLSPVTVVGGINNWSRVVAGRQHSLGLTSAGVAYAWGRGFRGPIGDGTSSDRTSPVTVVGGITTWSQIVAKNGFHSLGIRSDGVLYAWGWNNYGQLGDNSTSSRLSPIVVVGSISTWSQVSPASQHSLGLTSAGIAYAWGDNTGGRLGDNTNTNSRLSPVTVVGGVSNWSQISGGSYSLGLTSAGIAYGWGGNGVGAVGDGTATARSSPVTVIGGINTWTQITAGERFSLALSSFGQKGF